MATKAEILRQLATQSFMSGWGAIAAFDGATLAPMLADYYHAKVFGYQSLDPIKADRIPFALEQEVYGTLDQLVLQAPRIAFIPANLYDSRMRVSFELHSGVYTEQQRSVGQPAVINELINVGTGQRYTFSMELELADAVGTVSPEGQVHLTLGRGSNPQCNLGASPIAQQKVAEFLFSVLSPEQGAPWVVPLGGLITQRGFTLPTDFRIRTQAKPGSTNGEGALLVFIAKRQRPEDPLGSIPSNLPYLLADDNDAQGKPQTATLLVSRDDPKLRESDYDGMFGQLLFPNETYFKRSALHSDTSTRDVAVFGRIETPASQAVVLEDLHNVPGASAHVIRITLGENARPVALTASSSVAHGWTWELLEGGLGTIAPQEASAVFTPPAALEDEWFDEATQSWRDAWGATIPPGARRRRSRVRLQRVIARNRSTTPQLRREVCLILESGVVNRLAEFERPMEVGVAPDTRVPLNQSFDPGYDDYLTEWHVVGRGTMSGATYRSPLGFANDIELAVCTFFQPTAPNRMIAYGYCIIQLGDPAGVERWSGEFIAFILRADYAGARPLANGMQQLGITVLVEPVGDIAISDAELATLHLLQRNGQPLAIIPDTLEGLDIPSDPRQGTWGVRRQRNGFEQAVSNLIPPTPSAKRQARSFQFYVQTTADTPVELVARFTDYNNVVRTSNIPSGEESNFKVLRVTPLVVPVDDESHFDITIKRVAGGHQSKPPMENLWSVTNPNFPWNLRTTDYWTFRLKDGPGIVRFKRLQWEEDGPGVKWEREANANPVANEDAFSFMGYALIPEGQKPEFLEFAGELYNPLLWDGHSGFVDGKPPEARLRAADSGSVGTLLLALTRVTDVYYRQKASIPGFDLDRSAPFKATLWDVNGTRHRLEFGFEELTRNAPIFQIR